MCRSEAKRFLRKKEVEWSDGYLQWQREEREKDEKAQMVKINRKREEEREREERAHMERIRESEKEEEDSPEVGRPRSHKKKVRLTAEELAEGLGIMEKSDWPILVSDLVIFITATLCVER